MANTLHPLEQSLIDLGVVKRRLLRYFLRDGVIDSDERGILESFDQETDDISAYRKRQAANDKWEHNGDTRRTREAYEYAGYTLVSLDAERERKHARTKIVQLYPETKNAG